MQLPARPLAVAAVVLLSAWIPAASADPGEVVSLSDKSGRTIQAKIVLVVGDEVEIEMAGGKKHTLPISRFSLSSQELIRKQAAPAAESAPAPPVDFDDAPIFQFVDLEFKEKKTDHFRIRAIDTRYDPADKHAEKIFEVMGETMPTLVRYFENQQFHTMGKNPNARDFPEPDKLFRHEIYLVEESGDFQNLVGQYAPEFPDETNRQNFVNSSANVGNFVDHNHRFTVIRKEAGNPADQLLAHQLGFQLVGVRIARPNMPFWLRMGAGYYSEHKMFKKCAVFYIDFNSYYEESGVDDGGNMTKAEILSNTEPWTKPLKELCKKGKRVNLDRLFKVTTAELTPNDSGYAMALYSFMSSTPELNTKFDKLLDLIGEGSAIDPQTMADTFGYATPGEFEDAWYAYIMSSAFK